LLQGVAEAANYLLAEMNYEIAIQKALATFGAAANSERIYLFQNHPHHLTGDMAMSLQFEWTKTGTPSCQHLWQNQSYQTSGLERWYNNLSIGQPISRLLQEFPTTEKQLLSRDKIQSILFVPLGLDEDFCGYLGLADCTSQRHWSTHEKSSGLTMAAIISGPRQRQQVEEEFVTKPCMTYLPVCPIACSLTIYLPKQ
jgi:GAF domain-containing protein